MSLKRKQCKYEKNTGCYDTNDCEGCICAPQPEASRPMQIPAVVRGNQTRIEILPCPFCGKQAKYIEEDKICFVSCCHCDADGPVIDIRRDDSMRLAIEYWNKRV